MAKTEHPFAQHAMKVQITIKHIAAHCSNFTDATNEFHIPDNLCETIGPFSDVNKLISYLKKN